MDRRTCTTYRICASYKPIYAVLTVLLLLSSLCSVAVNASDSDAASVSAGSTSPTTPPSSAASSPSSSSSSASASASVTATSIRSYCSLLQRLSSLLFTPTAATTAVHLITNYTTSASTRQQAIDYTRLCTHIYIPNWDRRLFIDPAAVAQSTPLYREKLDYSDYNDNEDSSEDSINDSDNEDVIAERPQLRRCNIAHILAGRGFSAALRNILSSLSASSQRTLVRQRCTLAATLQMSAVTPLHILALYADDQAGYMYVNASTSDTAENTTATTATTATSTATTTATDSNTTISASVQPANVLTASLLINAGANVSSAAEPHALRPLALAAERGHVAVFLYLLSQYPSSLLSAGDSELDFMCLHPPPISVDTDSDEIKEWWHQYKQMELRFQTELKRLTSSTDLSPLKRTEEYIAMQQRREQWRGMVLRERPWVLTAAEKALLQADIATLQALQYALMSNRTVIVEHLLSPSSQPLSSKLLKQRINRRLYEGRGDTLLHGAVMKGYITIVQLLLSAGADPSLPTHDGLSLLRLAVTEKQFEMETFLKKYLREKRQPEIVKDKKTVERDANTDTQADTAATTSETAATTEIHSHSSSQQQRPTSAYEQAKARRRAEREAATTAATTATSASSSSSYTNKDEL